MEIKACRVSPTQMVQTVSVDVGNPDEVEKAMGEAVSRQGTVQARDNGAMAVSALCVFAIYIEVVGGFIRVGRLFIFIWSPVLLALLWCAGSFCQPMSKQGECCLFSQPKCMGRSTVHGLRSHVLRRVGVVCAAWFKSAEGWALRMIFCLSASFLLSIIEAHRWSAVHVMIFKSCTITCKQRSVVLVVVPRSCRLVYYCSKRSAIDE